MADFFEDPTFFNYQSAFFAGTAARKYIFDGYSADDALARAPREGTTLEIAGKTLRCTNVNLSTNIRSDAGEIICSFQTASGGDTIFKPWDLSFKKVDVLLPMFAKGLHNFTDASGVVQTKDHWYEQHSPLDIEFQVLSISVNRYNPGAVDNSGNLSDISRVLKQVYHAHELPLGGVWVMQPVAFRQVSYSHTQYQFTWVQDPGNTAPTVTLPDGTPDPDFVVPPFRPPWYRYHIKPAQSLDGSTPDGKPKIYLSNLYPKKVKAPSGALIDNPYYSPQGYRGLPGGPW